MSNHKYGFRNEIRYENQKAKEDRAKKDLKRNIYGLDFSAIVFFIVLLVTLNGVQINQSLTMLMGVFYFGRELRVLPLGQIIFSSVKAFLCIGMAVSYIVMHQGLWDWMDFSILGILAGVVLLDIPRVLKAGKELKS